MKKLLKKLRGRSGESIGETLVALLVSSMALVMLAGAIASASGIIKRSNTALEARYAGDQANALRTTWIGVIDAAGGKLAK